VWEKRPYKGRVGKIGVTSTSMKKRLQYYINTDLSNWEVLEEYDCKYKVSDREIELQKEYGYPVDNNPYWKILEMHSKQSKIKGGKVAGKKAVESGQLAKAARLGGLALTKEQCSKGGKLGGRKNVESGHMKRMQKIAHIASRKAILQYDMDGNFIKEWVSAAEACREENFSSSKICSVAKGNRNSHKGFVFKYKE
jgi:hypothetical protein